MISNTKTSVFTKAHKDAYRHKQKLRRKAKLEGSGKNGK